MKIKSNIVVISIFILTALLIMQVSLYANFFLSLERETQVISDLSRIRGDIQRYTKLSLASEIHPYFREHLSQRIDYYVLNEPTVERVVFQKYYDIKELQTEWEALLGLIDAYQQNPNTEVRTQIIEKSEHCWKMADSFVLRSEFLSNKTIASLKYFTITLALNLLIFIVFLILYKKYVHNILQNSSTRDFLTGVFNRRYFYEFLNHEALRAVRKNHTFSIILFDIDFFKKINDDYGHGYGDIVLQKLSHTVQSTIRKSDVLARIGGEEFIILLPDTDAEQAYSISEKIRETIAGFAFPEEMHITISLGVTSYREGELPETIISRADTGLYLAKNNGRNRSEKV